MENYVNPGNSGFTRIRKNINERKERGSALENSCKTAHRH